MDTRDLDVPVLLPSGEECLRCIGRLQESLTRIKGVEDAAVNNTHDSLHISYDPNLVTFARLESEARRIGAEITAQVGHVTFLLEDLDCPDCARSIERTLGDLPGVLWAGATFASGQVHVEFEVKKVTVEAIQKRIEAHGVHAQRLDRYGAGSAHAPVLEGATGAKPKPRDFFTRRTGQTALAGLLAIGGLLAHWAAAEGAVSWIGRGLYGAAILIGGWNVFRGAITSLRSRVVDMNVLMMLAVIGATATGEWGEAAAVVVLYGIGVALQATTLERTRRSIRALMTLTPPTARVLRGRSEQAIPVSEVVVGDLIIIRPGERIPMDGDVVSGLSTVNEAPITGESVPQEKRVGSSVYAGTLNGQGTLEFRVTKPYRDTVLARIVHTVEEAQAQRAPAEQAIDRFARIYTPIIFWLAVAIAIVPPALAAGEFAWAFPVWFHRSLSLLLIACPCALVISTPVAIVTALGTASRRGILVKGGAYLENVGTVKAIVYDKTGTLTEGQVKVHDVVPLGSLSGAEILGVAGAIEDRSLHPLAHAIRHEAARRKSAAPMIVTEFQEIPGRGIRATVNGAPYLLGSRRLFEAQKFALPVPALTALEEAEEAGMTAVLLGHRGGLEGLILLQDQPRPEAQAAIAALHRVGVVYQAMLTGDNPRVAAHVAKAAGLEEFEGGLLPEQKLQHIRHLQHRYGRVAMVGDGINDAPALAASDVGIAMGVVGSDTALEAADVALMQDDLSKLPFLIQLSRRTRAIVNQNVAISLFTKAALIVAAVVSTIPLWLAVLGDVGVAILVTVNSLRLLDGREVEAAPAQEVAGAEEPLLELVFINDRTVDEQPEAGYAYPVWERFSMSFTGKPIRFGRKAATSVLPVQIEDEGMSRLHGEIRLEGGRPVVIDLHSTNGIRHNSKKSGAVIPPERPTPLKFGDNLMVGRNTRIEVRRPGEFGVGAAAGSEAVASAGLTGGRGQVPVVSGSGTQSLRGKSGIPGSSQ